MIAAAELEKVIVDALAESEQLSKKDFNKLVDVDSAHLSSALRRLIRESRIVSGSDGSTRVYRLIRR